VTWQPCPDVVAQSGKAAPNVSYDCGSVAVPQDWAAPDPGRTFQISLLRARAAGQANRLGSLLVDPGGPGGSGVSLAVALSGSLPVDITRRFDVVGFDPRGVGRSNAVKCFSDADLDTSFGYEPDPRSQAEFDEFVAFSRRIADQCASRQGEALRYFSTEQTARDLDAIRAALGEEKLTYLGYSYGTLLGAVYAQLFPDRVRALVLDGAVDPTQKSVAGVESQARGFELAFGHFAEWCRQNNPTRCRLPADVRGYLADLLQSARSSPVVHSDGRKATPGWIMTAVLAAMYSESSWPIAAAALVNLARGDARLIFGLADSYTQRNSSGHYTNLFDIFTVVGCTDDDASPTLEQIRQLQSQWRDRYPVIGAQFAVGMAICSIWPAKRDPYPVGAARGAPPIVVVGTTGDPATPYEQTAKLAGMLGTGVVLTWQGEGHTAYPQTRCITEAVNNYLLNVVPPAAGTTCPAK
jgi:pimeloyl-ACP methyl ester carboxylesterase